MLLDYHSPQGHEPQTWLEVEVGWTSWGLRWATKPHGYANSCDAMKLQQGKIGLAQ